MTALPPDPRAPDAAASSPASMAAGEGDFEYAGFWIRLWASVIDTVLILAITTPILSALYGADIGSSLYNDQPFRPMEILVSWLLPALAVLVFWRFRSATPGKMVIRARIVDARTGAAPSTGQLIARYALYYLSAMPFCLGFLWIAFDRRKQGWHDKIARTVVIRKRPEPVRFD
jgi:uncharacterized RDD family membrane protein YckC